MTSMAPCICSALGSYARSPVASATSSSICRPRALRPSPAGRTGPGAVNAGGRLAAKASRAPWMGGTRAPAPAPAWPPPPAAAEDTCAGAAAAAADAAPAAGTGAGTANTRRNSACPSSLGTSCGGGIGSDSGGAAARSRNGALRALVADFEHGWHSQACVGTISIPTHSVWYQAPALPTQSNLLSH